MFRKMTVPSLLFWCVGILFLLTYNFSAEQWPILNAPYTKNLVSLIGLAIFGTAFVNMKMVPRDALLPSKINSPYLNALHVINIIYSVISFVILLYLFGIFGVVIIFTKLFYCMSAFIVSYIGFELFYILKTDGKVMRE
jgi:hypothetical protein